MPTKDKLQTHIEEASTGRETIYKGERPVSGKMTSMRMWTSITVPSVNNDEFDTAGLSQDFATGDLWNETTVGRIYKCDDPTQGAAVWTIVSSADDGLIGSKEVDETDLTDGSLPWYNSATGKFEYAARWDDLRFPASQVKRGAGSKPDEDFVNVGLLFPENVSTEYVVINAQFQHSYKLGSDIVPHVHFIQTVAAVPTFKIDYRWYDIGDTVPAYATISTTTVTAVTFAVGAHQIVEFPSISGAGISKVSSMMDIILYRDDTSVSGDILVKEFDIHFQLQSFGSENEDSYT